MKFQIDIAIKKIVEDNGLYYIYCDKPRALGEVLRHNYGIHPFAMTVWGQGVTLMEPEWNIVSKIFSEIEIEVKANASQGRI